jgi:ATP-dependent protease ClpP protease subunit
VSKRIEIKGVIISNDVAWIYEMFDIEHTTPKKVTDSINEADNEDLEVIINSGGGDVHVASEIYTELRSYAGNVITKIVGLAASAASVIAMAGNRTLMAPTGEMMVHNAATVAWGDYRTMDQASDMLQVTNKTIANAYRLKSGLEENELLELMNKETWLTPQDAKEKGLIDEIMFENEIKLSASSGVANMIPQEVIDGIRNGKLNKNNNETGTKEIIENLKSEIEELKNTVSSFVSDSQKNNKPPKDEPTQNKMSKLFLNL